MPQKFTVTLSDRTYKALGALGRQLDVPMADVIRESIALMWVVTEAVAEGKKVMIKDGTWVTELSIPGVEQARAMSLLERGKKVLDRKERPRGRVDEG